MQILFYLFAAISIFSALFVVAAKSPINSVIALIVCFLSIAGHYILLNAQFLAVVHIIVYTGAIMVLYGLFFLMASTGLISSSSAMTLFSLSLFASLVLLISLTFRAAPGFIWRLLWGKPG